MALPFSWDFINHFLISDCDFTITHNTTNERKQNQTTKKQKQNRNSILTLYSTFKEDPKTYLKKNEERKKEKQLLCPHFPLTIEWHKILLQLNSICHANKNCEIQKKWVRIFISVVCVFILIYMDRLKMFS